MITTKTIFKPNYTNFIVRKVLCKYVLILLLFSCNSYSSLIIEVSMEEEIKEAVLIIKGKMTKKYSKVEDIKQYYYDRNGQIKESAVKGVMYTTFVFTIDEVLYGTYESSTIEVKMEGGCYDSGICEEHSMNYNYDENEEAVIFLKKIFRNEQYTSTAGSYSAFSVNKNNIMNRKYHQNYGENIKQNYTIVNSKGKIQTKEFITIDKLKSIIVKTIKENLK